jgi:hypothetical protein
MVYRKPEILVSYYTADVLGTAIGNSSSCSNDNWLHPNSGPGTK